MPDDIRSGSLGMLWMGLQSRIAVSRAKVMRLATSVGLYSSDFFCLLGSMARTLMGRTAVGTVLTLVFLPGFYSIWFRVKPTAVSGD